MQHGKYTRVGEHIGLDPQRAATDLAAQLQQEDMAGVLFYCSADYDLPALADALTEAFDCPIMGCTSAGELGSTLQSGGIVGVSFSGAKFRVHPHLLSGISNFQLAHARDLAQETEGRLVFSERFDPNKAFAFLLVDGLSTREELISATLYEVCGLPLIGGSAGDSLSFSATWVFADGAFHQDAAVCAVFETLLPFKPFKIQHFQPSETDMVITAADVEQRVVTEINGAPAAEEYAELVGVERSELGPDVFSNHPVMLELGEDWYVRSIQKVNPDDSLTFFCAIDEGLPLTLGASVGYVSNLEEEDL